MKFKFIFLIFFAIFAFVAVDSFSSPNIPGIDNIVVENPDFPFLVVDRPVVETEYFVISEYKFVNITRSNVLKYPISVRPFGSRITLKTFYLDGFSWLNSEKNKFVYLC